MGTVISILVRVSRLATGVAFATLIIAVLIQIAGRLIGNSAVWTEELTRFALLFLAAFGAGLSFRSGDLVNVDLICESLPGDWPRRLRFAAAAATAILSGFLILPAWKYTSIGAMQTSAALGWRMDFIHMSMLVLLTSLLVFSLARAFGIALGQSDGRPENPFGEIE
jgi:TRAP-type C4-dicarboxylate transport system permease small subunit